MMESPVRLNRKVSDGGGPCASRVNTARQPSVGRNANPARTSACAMPDFNMLLEYNLRRKLNLPLRAGLERERRSGDGAECVLRHAEFRQVEIRMIGDVERLGAELDQEAFRCPEIPVKPKVEVLESGPAQGVASLIAEAV